MLSFIRRLWRRPPKLRVIHGFGHYFDPPVRVQSHDGGERQVQRPNGSWHFILEWRVRLLAARREAGIQHSFWATVRQQQRAGAIIEVSVWNRDQQAFVRTNR